MANMTEITTKDFNIKILISLLLKKKLFISVFTSIFIAISTSFALTLPDIYSSKSILSPVNQEDSLSSNLESLSTLGAFAGISLSESGSSQSQKAIERIKSFDFFSKYFLPNIELENIFALESWDAKNDTLIYNDSLYDNINKKWTRKVTFPKKPIPSNQEAFKVYKEILSIHQNKQTKFVTISIESRSPKLAKKWVDIIIVNINESMRNRDREIAQSSVDYLYNSSTSTNIKSIQSAYSNLLEKQMQILMLAESSDDYVFEILEPAYVNEDKLPQNKILIILLGFFIGILLSIIIVIFINHFSGKSGN